jgi:prepilin-type N-terminal cleavage/methylation domain-containing protein
MVTSKSTGRRGAGFSLIELVVVLMILSVLGGIAIPRYTASLTLYRTQAAAQRIAGDINLAQWQAKISSAGQTVVFSTAGNSYTLPGVAGLPGTTAAYTVKLAADPYDATMVSAMFGTGSTLTYDRFGQPSAGGTVVVGCGSFQSTITVDPNTGKASVQ